MLPELIPERKVNLEDRVCNRDCLQASYAHDCIDGVMDAQACNTCFNPRFSEFVGNEEMSIAASTDEAHLEKVVNR